jgi:predicted PurR-regulated permease PerM
VADAPSPGGQVPVRELEVEPRSVLVALTTLGVVLATVAVLASVPRTVVYVGLGVFLALAVDPLVGAVQRRLGAGRRLAVAVVLAGIAAGLMLLAVFVVPAAIRQSRALGDDLPKVVADLGDLPLVGDELVENDVPARVEQWVDDLPERLSLDATPLERIARTAADGLLAFFSILLVAVALLIERDSLIERGRRWVPAARRDEAERAASILYRSVGRYAAGSVLVALLAGVFTLALGLGFGVPLSPLAAVWVAFWNLIPQIGGAVGGVPFILLAFTQGTGTGVAVAAIWLVYLQVENHVIGPVVVGQAIRLSPLATMIAALIGVGAGGVVGALVAVPLTGAVNMIAAERREPQ